MSKVIVRQVVIEHLTKQIINGILKSGESIIEAEIANELGISRTPIREALAQLEKEGLLTYIPNRGYFVSEITQRDIDEICDIRKMLEVYCLKFCIDNITDEDIERMREELLRVDEYAKIIGYFEKDRSFHRTITSYCPNNRVQAYIAMIDKQEERLRRTLSVIPNRLEKVRDGHLHLLEILEKRDYEKAQKALEEHLDAVHESMIYAYKISF